MLLGVLVSIQFMKIFLQFDFNLNKCFIFTCKKKPETISYAKPKMKSPQKNSTFLKYKRTLAKIKLFIFDVVFAEITSSLTLKKFQA